jgi:hypothetical protein
VKLISFPNSGLAGGINQSDDVRTYQAFKNSAVMVGDAQD